MVRFFVLAMAGSGIAAPLDAPVIDPLPRIGLRQEPACPPTSRYDAMQRGGEVQPRRLGELPSADAYAAVWRKIGPCDAPVMVRYGIGGR